MSDEEWARQNKEKQSPQNKVQLPSDELAEEEIAMEEVDSHPSYTEGPRVTVFDFQQNWKLVLNDFANFEPQLYAMLSLTQVETGNFNDNPFPVRVAFPRQNEFAHQSFMEFANSRKKLQDYLETVLQRKINLKVELDSKAALSDTAREMMAPKTGPQIFEMDMQDEPILRTLQNIFQTEHKRTQRLHRRQEEKSENEEENES